MSKVARDIVRRPLITERASQLQESANRYVFEVRGDATKIDIRRAVEEIFEVTVTKVNTASVRGKVKRMGRFQGRRASWKKAIVSVADGQTIDFFEEV
jgi:large subunit ribosomal protein L23